MWQAKGLGFRQLVIVPVLALGLGCSRSPKPPAVPSDTTPPTVITTLPASGAVGVALNSTFTVTFSEAMDAGTLTTTTLLLASPSGSVAGSVSTTGMSATFTPAAALANGTTYTATVTPGVKDLAGNALATAHTWTFTTLPGARVWGTAAVIETLTGQAYSPRVATNANGTSFAVWRQYDGSGNRVWANRFLPGTGWGTATIIQASTDPAGPPVGDPAVAVDPNGHAMVVWNEFDPGAPGNTNITSIWSARYTAGTGWGAAQLVETGPLTAGVPQVAMDPNGNAIVVWTQDNKVRANRHVPGTGWGTDGPIETANVPSSTTPLVAMDASGNAMAVWSGFAGARANRYVAGTGWGTATDLGTTGRHLQLAVTASGNATVVSDLMDAVSGLYSIRSNRYLAGSGWQAVEVLDTNIDIGSDGSPKVAVSSSDDAIAVWSRFEGAQYHIMAAKRPAAASWGAAVRLDRDTGSAGGSQVAMNANGDSFLVFYQHDGNRNNIWSSRRLAADPTWSTAELIETDNANSAAAPQVGVDGAGNAVAVWRQSDNTRDNIWSNQFR